MNFKTYITGLKRVDPFMFRVFIRFLMEKKLYNRYKRNADRHPYSYFPYAIKQASQFFGWAFCFESTPEGGEFWYKQNRAWQDFVNDCEYYVPINETRSTSFFRNTGNCDTPFDFVI